MGGRCLLRTARRARPRYPLQHAPARSIPVSAAIANAVATRN